MHLLAEHLVDSGPDFFVRNKLPVVELLQTLCHLLAKPRVMINVMFHKLLNIFLRAALVLGSSTFHFRLQFWRKMHFHIFLD